MNDELLRYFFREVLAMAQALDAFEVKFYKRRVFIVHRETKRKVKKKDGDIEVRYVHDKVKQKEAEKLAPYVAFGTLRTPYQFASRDDDPELGTFQHSGNPRWSFRFARVWRIDKDAIKFAQTGDQDHLHLGYALPPYASTHGDWPFDTHAFSDNKWRKMTNKTLGALELKYRELRGKFYLDVREFARARPNWPDHCYNFYHLIEALPLYPNWVMGTSKCKSDAGPSGLYSGRTDPSRSWLNFIAEGGLVNWVLAIANSDRISYGGNYSYEDVVNATSDSKEWALHLLYGCNPRWRLR